MKIISWNVNSVRARITNIVDYIKQSNPDILLLQEIKTQDENFPYEDFKNIGYYSYVFGQKSYNGVAIISKQKLEKINNSFIKDDLKQSRIITAELKFKKKKLRKIINPDQLLILNAFKQFEGFFILKILIWYINVNTNNPKKINE